MACPNRLCKRFIFSDSVTFTSPNLIINIPEASYNNGERYCLVVGQGIPEDTTIAASVGITIGDDADTIYPLVNSNCTNVSACGIATRGIYPVIVRTNIQSGVFKLINSVGCCGCNTQSAPALPIPTEPTTTGGEG